MGVFIDLKELPSDLTSLGWQAALRVAVDLEVIRLRHAAERHAGLRAY